MNGARHVSSAASGRVCDRRPVAERAVADLVVVGGEDDEALGRDVVGGRAEAAAAERRERAVVDVRAVERLGQRAEVGELLVPAVGLAGQRDVQRVVEVVGPGRVAAPAALLGRAHHLRVVQPGLGDHERARVGGVDAAGDRRDDVLRVGVDQRVDRVEAQAVDVEVADPALGGLQDPLAHRVGLRVVEVDRLAPRRRVLVGQVRPERLHRLHPGRAEVVVDDVEDHGEALRVGGVDEALEAERAAVGGVRRRRGRRRRSPSRGGRGTRRSASARSRSRRARAARAGAGSRPRTCPRA